MSRAYAVKKLYDGKVNEHRISYNVAYYHVIGTPIFLAITNERNEAFDDLNELIVTETQRQPLYKQIMAINMGRKPKDIQNNRVFRLKQIDPTEYGGQYYEVYMARKG